MKVILFLVVSIVLCSFTGIRMNNSLIDSKLKEKVKSVKEYQLFIDSGKEDTVSIASYLYDTKGNETFSNINYGTDTGKSDSWMSYRYDEKGIKIEECQYNKEGSIYWKKKFSYNKNGDMIEDNRYSDSEKLLQRNIYFFDSIENTIYEVDFSPNGWVYDTISRKYDKNNNLIELNRSLYSMPNKEWQFEDPNAKICWKYDNNQNEIACAVFDRKNQLQTMHTYILIELDSLGNWVKRQEFIKSRYDATYLYKREISYY